jgi:plastocyanin
MTVTYPPVQKTPGALSHATLESQSQRTREIAVYDDYFSPPLLMVRTGTVVAWKNRSRHMHTITFAKASPAVDSGPLAPGAEFSVSCASPGVYRYSCRLHGRKMSGVLYVYSEFYMPEMTSPGRKGQSGGSRGY